MSKTETLDDGQLSEVIGAGSIECSPIPRWCDCPDPPPERDTDLEGEGPGQGSTQDLQED